MIQETMTHVCRVCERTHIVKNGTHRCGNAQDHCKDCGTYRVLKPKQAYAETEQHTVLRLAWSVVACVELHASLPWRGKPLRAGSKRTSRTCLMAKKPFCLRHPMTFSNWMKSGVLCAKKITNDGCGRRCAAERAKSWGSPLASEAKPPAAVCGRAFQMTTSTATPSVIFGMPTNTCFRLKPIMVLGRKLGRLRIWNGGTTPCVNEWAATFDKRCPFPNLMSIMTWFPSSLLFSII